MPAMLLCSRSTPLIWARPARCRMPSSTSMVKSSASGSGPSRAMPSIRRVADDVERQALAGPGLGDVEPGAVVEHDPGRQRRLAVGPRGHLRHLVAPPHPAGRARCSTRWVPPASMSRNLPCRLTPSTIAPASAVIGRVVGLQAAERGDVDPDDGAAVEPPGQVGGEGFDLGQLRHGVNGTAVTHGRWRRWSGHAFTDPGGRRRTGRRARPRPVPRRRRRPPAPTAPRRRRAARRTSPATPRTSATPTVARPGPGGQLQNPAYLPSLVIADHGRPGPAADGAGRPRRRGSRSHRAMSSPAGTSATRCARAGTAPGASASASPSRTGTAPCCTAPSTGQAGCPRSLHR